MTKIRTTFLASLAGVFLLNTALVCAEGSKLVLGTKVEKYVMQNERDHFAFHDGQVWAQIELKPATDGHVTFVWTRDGKPYSEFKATTKQSDRYRTQSFVTARPGKWHVAVKSQENVVLAEKDFVVDGMDGMDNGMASKSHDAKKASKTTENTDSKKVSGINDALKAMTPSGEKPAVKVDEKSAAKVDVASEKAKAPEVKKDAKPESSKPKASDKAVEIKPTDAKAANVKPTDARPADVKATEAKPVENKAVPEKSTDAKADSKMKADEKPASPKA